MQLQKYQVEKDNVRLSGSETAKIKQVNLDQGKGKHREILVVLL